MNRRDLWLLLPRPVRRLPADLAAVGVLAGLTLGTVFLPGVNETPLRVVFGLVFVLFLPGYAFIAALFPEAGETAPEKRNEDVGSEDDNGWSFPVRDDDNEKPDGVSEDEAEDGSLFSTGTRDRNGIDGIERVALSFGLSIAITPLIGLALNFTPWGIRLVPITLSVTAFTLGCVAVAAIRRWELPEDERFVVPYREWIDTAKTEVFEPDDRVDAALNVVLALSILLAVGSVGYAIAVPPQGEQFTEFYLLTEDDDGELVADGYPEQMVVGETAELIVGIENNEHQQTEYTTVVQLQETETEGNETTVIDREEIDRFSVSLDHNETHHEQHTLDPTRSGEELRVQYLLYADDDVPEEPTRENAYRDLHIWIDVVSATHD